MAGDYSRITFDPTKHYTRVLMQQGRVQLDADWNEQAALIAHRIETESLDVIGLTGAPKYGGNFKIGTTPDNTDLTIAPGRIYVDGLLCEIEAQPVTLTVHAPGTKLTLPTLWLDGRKLAGGQWLEVHVGKSTHVVKVHAIDDATSSVTLAHAVSGTGAATVRRVTTFLTQPYADATTTFDHMTNGTYLVYLDVFEREISAIDDPLIREVALGGPDTARRLQTVWRLRLFAVSNSATCDTAAQALKKSNPPANGFLAARTKPAKDEPDPCLLPPTAGYRGLENQLYRIEIQNGGQLPSANPPTFKWSRDEATVESAITNVSGSTVTVTEIGKDDVLRFNVGDWVEIVDDESILSGKPRPLAQIGIGGITDASGKITLSGSPTIPPTGTKGLRLRKWDQRDAATASGLAITADTWLDVEAGVQVLFSSGLYHSGDYWVIPARTAIADVLWPPDDHPPKTPPETPVPRPPLGIAHHYASLQIITRTGTTLAAPPDRDCRDLFPPLNHICAADVCFDDTVCAIPGAKTVQDAIDALCARSDLQTHNRYLHGCGVVCGLQVECGGGSKVTVKPGYALDWQGNDLEMKSAVTLDVNSLPFTRASLPPGSLPHGSLPPGPPSLPRGEFCLVIERGPQGQPQFHLTDHHHPETLQEFLEPTLLNQIYEHCLKPFADYARTAFDPSDTDPNKVSQSQKRIIAAWNLLIQLWNPTNGGHVYLSRAEHDLLVGVYNDLKKLATSSTFCSLLDDGLTPVPNYPFDPVKVATVFGKNAHTRLRMATAAPLYLSAGSDDKINVYANDQMVRQIHFYVNGATVSDAVFISPNLFVAVAPQGVGTAAGLYDANTGNLDQQWFIKDHQIVTLGFSKRHGLLGVALDEGLMHIPSNAQPTFEDPKNMRRTKGQMAIFDGPQATVVYLTSRTASSPASPKYNAVTTYFIGQAISDEEPLNGREGDDDVTFFVGDRVSFPAVVTDPFQTETTKHLFGNFPGAAAAPIDLLENTKIRLAAVEALNACMVVYEDSYRMRVIAAGKLDPDFAPTQICPSAVTIAGGDAFVLNSGSRTVTHYGQGATIAVATLQQYRRDLLHAFTDLAAVIFESLKDCVCEEMLPDCNLCGPADPVILGCFEMRDGKVRRICNFEGRKYVKTFRGVGYWLSLIPVIPLLRYALEKFCCLDLSTLIRKYQVPAEGGNRFQCGDPPPFVSTLRGLNLTEIRQTVTRKASLLQKVALVSASNFQPRKDVTVIDPATLVGQDPAQAAVVLKSANVNVVGTEAFDPAAGAQHVLRAVTDITPGSNVSLVVDKGKVVYVRAATPVIHTEAINRTLATAKTDVQTLRADINAQRKILNQKQAAINEATALRTEVTSLRTELENVRAAHQTALATINELQSANTAATSRIDELTLRTTELAKTAADVEKLKTTVAKLSRKPPKG